jgi:hypothetical protein
MSSPPSRVHRLACEVQGQHLSAWFTGGRRLAREQTPDQQLLDLPAYRQLDDHSCGFIAALTIAQYFDPDIRPEDVLAAVRPSIDSGCDQRRLVRALRRFGVTAEYREDLDRQALFGLAGQGVPVAVTVWLAEYGCDHWAVVRGIDWQQGRVYLVNDEHSSPEKGLPWREFEAVWCPRGGGLVCRHTGRAPGGTRCGHENLFHQLPTGNDEANRGSIFLAGLTLAHASRSGRTNAHPVLSSTRSAVVPGPFPTLEGVPAHRRAGHPARSTSPEGLP